MVGKKLFLSSSEGLTGLSGTMQSACLSGDWIPGPLRRLLRISSSDQLAASSDQQRDFRTIWNSVGIRVTRHFKSIHPEHHYAIDYCPVAKKSDGHLKGFPRKNLNKNEKLPADYNLLTMARSIPAAAAASNPALLSSRTRQSRGATSMRRAASRNMSGKGLPRFTCSLVTIT